MGRIFFLPCAGHPGYVTGCLLAKITNNKWRDSQTYSFVQKLEFNILYLKTHYFEKIIVELSGRWRIRPHIPAITSELCPQTTALSFKRRISTNLIPSALTFVSDQHLPGVGKATTHSAKTCLKNDSIFSFVCLFVPSLSSNHEKATVALYFGQICTRLGVVHFRVFCLFLWFLSTKFAACSKPPSRDNHRKASYPRTQQRVRWGWDLKPRSRDCNHTVAIKTAL